MPAADSPAIIVARFLKANHYNDTLDTFIAEAGLPPHAGTVEKGDLTIEKILEEKKIFDLSLNVEKLGLGVGDADEGWNQASVSTLPTTANLLHVSIQSDDDTGDSQLLVATTADRRMNLFRLDAEFPLVKSHSHLQDSPILACVSLGDKSMITLSSGMSGEILLYDHGLDKVLETRRDHNKYVVQITVYRAEGGVRWVATAGWDGRILVYMPKPDDDSDNLLLGPPVAFVSLSTNPEAILFVENAEGSAPVLIATRRDSTSLYYYSLHSVNLAVPPLTSPVKLELLGTQNLAPHSNAWIAFSPSSLALCPTDSSLLAVATSSIPHMKLIIVQMLLPSSVSALENPNLAPTQAGQARENLARQDREDAAIRVNISTLAPRHHIPHRRYVGGLMAREYGSMVTTGRFEGLNREPVGSLPP
ncbi:hypothetical protein G7Y79_00045g080870 [Physcia stellaris]|nr:hypothetical protein G7Y79_00045g080870 [Physcia stellaris]